MSGLIRSEIRKVVTTKLWWGMLLGAMAFAALAVVSQIAANGVGTNPAQPLSSPETQRGILASGDSAYLFSVIVGIILVTTEFRHFTSRPTFLLEPRRGRVIGAKLIVAAGIGLFYGICCVAVSVAIAVPWLAARHVSLDWTGNGLIVVMVGTLLVVAVFAIVGLGVGVLIRNQIAAVIGTLAYLFVLEPLVSVIPVVKDAYRFLPGAAAAALTGAQRPQTVILNNWQGGLMLLGWGLLFAVTGWFLTVRRDIP